MKDSNCPYCRSKVLDKDVTNHNYAQCAKCGIPHHFQCYCENDSHCGIYGCDGKTISTIPREITDLVVQEPKELCATNSLENFIKKYTELSSNVSSKQSKDIVKE